MPAAASIRAASSGTATGPWVHDAPGGGGRTLRAGFPDGETLVAGYLAAVAAALHQNGLVVATLQVHGACLPGPGGPGPSVAGVPCGTLHLRPRTTGPRHPTGSGLEVGWAPTQLDWHPDTGCSARLRRGVNGHRTVWRYLHTALLPAPAEVAAFVAALDGQADVGWATPGVFRQRPRKILSQLGRYGGRRPRPATVDRPGISRRQ